MKNVLILAVIFVGCGGGGGQVVEDTCPRWINLGNRDPKGRYIYGVGYGYSPIQAQDSARAEIAKFFDSEVEKASTSLESYSQQGSSYHYTFSSSIVVSTETHKALEGVMILKKAHCRGRYWALAGLPLEETRRRLSRKLHEGLDRARFFLNKAKEVQDPLRGLGYALRSLEVADSLRGLQADMIALGGRIPDTRRLVLEALKLFEGFREQVAFAVCGSAEGGGTLANLLDKRGLKIVPCASGHARVKITISYRAVPTNRALKRYKWVKATLQITAVDTQSNQLVYQYGPKSFEAAGMTLDDAYARAEYLLKNTHFPKLVREMLAVLFGFTRRGTR